MDATEGGEVAKRSNASDCKSDGPRPSKVRILPSPPASAAVPCGRAGSRNGAGVAQLVELQPSKLDVAGSNPVARSRPLEGGSRPRGGGSRGARRKAGATPHPAGGNELRAKREFTPVSERGCKEVHAHWSREPRCSTWRRQRAASETGIHSRQRAGVPGGARALGSREPRCSTPWLNDDAHVAQSVERVLGKDEVTSSILVVGSTPRPTRRRTGFADE